MNVFVLVRNCRLLRIRKAINPFPTVVRIQRNQPRTQNRVSIEFRTVAFFVREKGEFSTLLKKENCTNIAIEV